MPPNFIVCYVCGKQFGKASLAIHQAQCIKLFEAQQAKLPPEERRALPADPGIDVEGGSVAAIEAANAAALAAHEAAQAKCPHCGRTFNHDRLPIHLRSCTAEHPAKAVGEMRAGENVGPVKAERADAVREALEQHHGHTVDSMSQYPETSEAGSAALRPRPPAHAAGTGAKAARAQRLSPSKGGVPLETLEARVGQIEAVISNAVAELSEVKRQIAELREGGHEPED